MNSQTEEDSRVTAARAVLPDLKDPQRHQQYTRQEQDHWEPQRSGEQDPNFLLKWLEWLMELLKGNTRLGGQDEEFQRQLQTSTLVARWNLPQGHPDSLMNHTANQYAGRDTPPGGAADINNSTSTNTNVQVSINRDEFAPYAMAANAGDVPAGPQAGSNQSPGVTVQSDGPLSPHAQAGVELAAGYYAAVDAVNQIPDEATRRTRMEQVDQQVQHTNEVLQNSTTDQVSEMAAGWHKYAGGIYAEAADLQEAQDRAEGKDEPTQANELTQGEPAEELAQGDQTEAQRTEAQTEATQQGVAPQPGKQEPTEAKEQAPAAKFEPANTAGKAIKAPATTSNESAANDGPSTAQAGQSSVPAVATAQQVTNGQSAVPQSNGQGRSAAGDTPQVGAHTHSPAMQQRQQDPQMAR